MDEKENTDCPWVDIVRTLRNIPDRGKPRDREVAADGTEILLYRKMDDIRNWKMTKNRKSQKRRKDRKDKRNQKGRKKR